MVTSFLPQSLTSFACKTGLRSMTDFNRFICRLHSRRTAIHSRTYIRFTDREIRRSEATFGRDSEAEILRSIHGAISSAFSRLLLIHLNRIDRRSINCPLLLTGDNFLEGSHRQQTGVFCARASMPMIRIRRTEVGQQISDKRASTTITYIFVHVCLRNAGESEPVLPSLTREDVRICMINERLS